MVEGGTKPRPAKRQHFIARFYLRNFAEPIFSNNLSVYDMSKRRWERRTSAGVGWFPHLCSMIDLEGDRTEDFDHSLKFNCEDPAAPALKKLPTGESLEANERASVALLGALTAARSPELIKSVMTDYVNVLPPADRAELDTLVKL